ncbi:hypothetical protein AB1K70_20250 [Bremerella sp. JC770]|uniref:toxin-antitoxin system YwqK family antitoxin n=1 Tax=Bremerella sp. JC770 TaxID=3232137 RepID=UPI003457B18D
MPRFPLALLVALLAVVAGCTSNSSAQPSGDQASQAENADHPTPEIRSDGAHVYTFDGVEYPFPAILTFDGGAWNRDEPIWIDGQLYGLQYVHTQRPRKLLYRIVHDDEGFSVLLAEGSLKDGKWALSGKEQIEFANGEKQESFNVDGVSNGEVKTYRANGNLKSVISMINGKMHGPHSLYYENGQLQSVVEMVDDKPVKVLESYDENGNKMTTKADIEKWGESIGQ